MTVNELVSVVVPMYNAEDSISKTIDSILDQSYDKIEIIVVDDLSTDRSKEIVLEYVDSVIGDRVVKYLSLESKGGASEARNLAIREANGRYIAFLDADDTWKSDKLEKQIGFMKKNNYAFTYTNYDVVNDEGEYLNTVHSPEVITYKSLIKYNAIGCLTVVYDATVIKNLSIPRLDKRNDYALWLKALRPGIKGYLVNETLATYYRQSQSLSRGKSRMTLLKYHYEMYRNVLGYNIISSAFLTFRNAVLSLIKK